MAEQYRFFGSAVGDVREYSQPEFAEVLGTIIGNGYLGQVDEELVVTQNTPAGMSVLVGTGQAWINGYWYANDTDKVITIATADPTNPRIDRVVLRLDILNARSIVAVVITGTPASTPVAPSLTQTDQLWEIPLYQVLVEAATLSIVNAKLTDERYQALLQDTDEILAQVALKAPIASPTFTGNVAGITKTMVGLGNVDNTSDVNKPVSSAQQTALNGKLSLTGGTLTGALNGTTITTTGAINANGGQIKFPATQNPSADANTLDDYEEGIWTPTDAFGVVSFTSSTGRYIKIGNFIMAQFDFTVSSNSNGTYITIYTPIPAYFQSRGFVSYSTYNGVGNAIMYFNDNMWYGSQALTYQNASGHRFTGVITYETN